MHVKNLSILL